MEIKPEDELSNIVLFPVKEDDRKRQRSTVLTLIYW